MLLVVVALVLTAGTIMLALRGCNTDQLDAVLESAIGPLVGVGLPITLIFVYWFVLTAIFGGAA